MQLKYIGGLFVCFLLAHEVSGRLLQAIMPHYQVHSDACDLVFISMAIMAGAVVKSLLSLLPFGVSSSAVLLIFGLIIGGCCHYSEFLWNYTRITTCNPYYFLAAVAPTVIFGLAFNVDAHTFTRSWSQILITIPVVVMINSVSIGFLMKVVIGSNWTVAQAMMFGLLATPVYPQLIVGVLKDVGYHTKHAISLLEGEAMGVLLLSTVLFRIMNEFDQNVEKRAEMIVLVLFWYPFMGLIIGYVSGKVLCIIIRHRCHTPPSICLWIIGTTYTTYFISETYCKASGIGCVISIGILMGLERQNFTNEIDHFLVEFWELAVNITNMLIAVMAGVIITKFIALFMSMSDYPPFLITYCISSIMRVTTFFILTPILSRISYGFTMNKLMLISWGNIRSQLCVVLSWIGMENTYGQFGIQLCANITGSLLLTLLINVTSMPFMLNYLNMGQMSNFKKSNMNNCFRHVLESRERSIAMLKMDRFLSDANWPTVQKYSTIKHPYHKHYSGKKDDDKKDISVFGNYQLTCPDCSKEVVSEPTRKELKDMKKEARLRVLKAKKISYMKQYEKGLLSRDGLRVLSSSVETATESKEALIDLQGLYKLFAKQGFFHFVRKHILEWFNRSEHKDLTPPRKPYRRLCYMIVTKTYFDIIINVVILLNIVPIVIDLYYVPETFSNLNLSLVFLNHIFCGIYLNEFVMKILAYSVIRIFKHGFKTYFSSWWNIFDFIILVVSIADLIMDYLDLAGIFNRNESRFATGARIMRSVRIIRLIRLLKLCKAWYPHVVTYFDLKIDMHMAFSYEIGKGFVKGEEEVLDLLPQIVDNVKIREELKIAIETDKLAVTREIGLIQKDRPWIAVTVKTIQAMRSTLNNMMNGIVELKVSGWIDDFEHTQLLDSLNERISDVNNLKSVPSCEPKIIFYEVSWMAGDQAVSDFLYANVHSKLYDAGEPVCTEGVFSEGIMIVVSGLLKLSYNPSPENLDFQAENGCLAVVDYISNMQEKAEEYIISGNTIGEISTLTNRPYDCDIVAETQTHVYILSREVIAQAFDINQDPLNGLEARLWKSISIRTALSILMDVPAYQSLPQEKIKMTLETSFVPNISNFKIFTNNDMIEDIILIEGIIIDYNSRECFFGPSYIPRTVQRLVLSKSSQMTIVYTTQVKLLIIPTKDVSIYELMATTEAMSQLIDNPTVSFQKLFQSKTAKPPRFITKGQSVASSSKSDDETELHTFQMDMRSSIFPSFGSKKSKLTTATMSSSIGKQRSLYR